MKKVLALVLAVMMLCTMAFAADVIIDPSKPATPSDPETKTYDNLEPGQTIAINTAMKDKDGNDLVSWYLDKDGKFVPAKNVVTVTFAKGAELVKSQGWVKLEDGNYQYQITLKSDLTKAADKKVAEIQISAISVKAYGYNAVSLFKAAKAEEYISYSFGYDTNDMTLTEGGAFVPTEKVINVVKALYNKGNKEVSTLEVAVGDMTYTVSKGTKFYMMADAPEFTAKEMGTAVESVKFENPLNLAAKVSFAKKTLADKTLKAYAKTADGKVLAVAVTENDGVMSFTVPAMSTVILTEGTLTTSGTTGETGTTTNPGTGANDVVGVAAALAVVALVSGAAISLKK